MARFAGTALTDYFNTPDFTAIGGTNMEGQSLQRNTATKAEGLVHGAGVNSTAQVAQAGFQADAIKAQGQAQGQASMASGIGSMVSGIAGGFALEVVAVAAIHMVDTVVNTEVVLPQQTYL